MPRKNFAALGFGIALRLFLQPKKIGAGAFCPKISIHFKAIAPSVVCLLCPCADGRCFDGTFRVSGIADDREDSPGFEENAGCGEGLKRFALRRRDRFVSTGKIAKIENTDSDPPGVRRLQGFKDRSVASEVIMQGGAVLHSSQASSRCFESTLLKVDKV